MLIPFGSGVSKSQLAAAVAKYLQDNPPAAGPTGPQGPGGSTLVANVALTQTAAIAIALGIREVSVACPGAVVGGRYIAFAVTYRLNGAAAVAGRPTGYAIVDCVCNTAGQITVSLNAPLLAIGQSYVINCDIVRINT